MSEANVAAGAGETHNGAPVHIAPLRGWPRAVVRWLILLLLRPFVALSVVGLDHVPATGAFLLVANHLHNADPVILQAALRRPVHFMAKEELFRNPLFSALIRSVGSFPVNRQRPGRTAIRHAVALLAAGIPVGLFPEGTRSSTGRLGSAYSGAGLIANESDCVIVPVAILGTERLPGGAGASDRPLLLRRFWRRYRVTVRFGLPFTLSQQIRQEPRASAAATKEMMLRIAALLPPAYQGDSVTDSAHRRG